MKKSIRKIKNALENPNFVKFVADVVSNGSCFWDYRFYGGGREYVGDSGSCPAYQDVDPEMEATIKEDEVLEFVFATLKINNSKAKAYIEQSGFVEKIAEMADWDKLYDVCWEDFKQGGEE